MNVILFSFAACAIALLTSPAHFTSSAAAAKETTAERRIEESVFIISRVEWHSDIGLPRKKQHDLLPTTGTDARFSTPLPREHNRQSMRIS
jgi:hypothetical protein